MSRYKAIVAYEGSLFKGWQTQVDGITVQDSIEQTLSRMEKKPVSIVGSGRTDRGVNALGQVFHFDSELNIPIDRFPLAINNQLVDGIHIKSIEKVDDSFHARKDAKAKVYQYHIEMGDYQLFERNHVYQLNKSLDVTMMEKSAQVLIGTHDFTSFNTTPLEVINNQVRTLYSIQFKIVGSQLHIEFIGSGFLRYMIRMIVMTLINVGLHKLDENVIEEFLLAKEKGLVIYNAPPEGLTLMKVKY